MMTVQLDRRLYKVGAVTEAANDFSSLASFEIHSDRHNIHIAISKVDPDVADVLVDEFLNFALAATIAARG